MDELRRLVYRLAFDRQYLLRKGSSFQEFFSSIMEKRHGPDFTKLRAWGALGDKKNDGHLTSSETVFQCYAPDDMTSAAAVAKIEEDFAGAVTHWLPFMKEWVFVHNAPGGLGPDVHMKLLELQSNPDGVRISHWGLEELWSQVMGLGQDALAELFGPVPAQTDFIQLGYEDLRQVLESIETGPPLDDSDVRPVSRHKLQRNRLSDDIRSILRQGMTKSDLVRRYLEDGPDPTLGDRLAHAIKQKYLQLRGIGRTPDEIFFELETFVGGSTRAVPRREVAIYAVLAYFFEQCDIFEHVAGPPE